MSIVLIVFARLVGAAPVERHIARLLDAHDVVAWSLVFVFLAVVGDKYLIPAVGRILPVDVLDGLLRDTMSLRVVHIDVELASAFVLSFVIPNVLAFRVDDVEVEVISIMPHERDRQRTELGTGDVEADALRVSLIDDLVLERGRAGGTVGVGVQPGSGSAELSRG